MYTDSEVDKLLVTLKTLSMVSLFGTFFIICTWATFKVKRSQPLTLFFGFASSCISLTFIIPLFSYSEVSEYACTDNTQAVRQEDGGMCIFQSVWITYWVLAACAVWLVQSYDLFLRIVQNKRHLDHMSKYYHAFIWLYPLFVLIVLLGTDALGYSPGNYWCFVHDREDNPELQRGLDLGLFYGSIIAICFFGLSMMLIVLHKIYVITSNTRGVAQVSNTAMKRLALYRTPVFFVTTFSLVWFSIFSWRFDAEVKKSDVAASAAIWASCLLNNFAMGISDPATNPEANSSELSAKYGIENNTGCGEVYPVRISLPGYIYLMCIAGSQGIFVFIIFGAKLENFNLWRERFGLTSKKYDTTADNDSSTKDRTAKPSTLGKAVSSLFSHGSPKINNNDSVGESIGGTAVMSNGLQSGKFIAVTEADTHAHVKGNQVAAAAYMSEG